MLIAPLPTRRKPRSNGRTRQIASVTDEQEANAFMAFMGEHSTFAASHRGA